MGKGLNVTALKKISRGTGESFSYISRQALRYNIVEQMEKTRQL
jgi:CRISPR-associated protein Cst2